MFGLFSRFQYRTELFVNVMQLLILYPGGADALKKDYPGIKSAIADHAKKGTPIHNAAVMIAASVLGDLATKVPEDAKPIINEQLRTLDYERFHEYLVQRLRGETSTKLDESITYGTMIFAAAFCIGDQWAEHGKVARDDFCLIMSEVVGALRGLSPGERSSGRIMRALDGV